MNTRFTSGEKIAVGVGTVGNGTQGGREVEGRTRDRAGKGQEDHETGGRDSQQSARAIREYREAQK